MAEYFYIIDYIEAFFWTITYILIALVGFVNKNDRRLAMPKISLFVNFAWEVASVLVIRGSYLDQGGIIRLAWLIFDVVILVTVFLKNKSLPDFKEKLLRISVPWIVLTVFFAIGFENSELFMPISAFIIDAGMEVCFWMYRRRIDPSLRLYIGISKILGDFLAGMYYGRYHISVVILAVVAFIFDVLYIVYAINEKRNNRDINSAFKANFQLLLENLKIRRSKQIEHHNARKYKKKKVKKTHRKK